MGIPNFLGGFGNYFRFEYPELFLVAIPIGYAYYRWSQATGVTGWIRICLLALLILTLTGPSLNWWGDGTDVIVVADRSLSMPTEANVKELIDNLERNRGTSSRVGVVTFGATPHVEHVLSNRATVNKFSDEVTVDGSDLAEALETALNLVEPARPARILVLSDGENTGALPHSASRRAREMGVPIDFRDFERPRQGDSAIHSVQVPEMVSPQEPFQFAVWVYADTNAEGTVRVSRLGQQLAKSTRTFSRGLNRVLFRDILIEGGIVEYEAALEIALDPQPKNNVGVGVVRVEAKPKILVLNSEGHDQTNLVSILRSGGLSIDVAAADAHPLTLDALDQYRAVIIENLPARELGIQKMMRLAQFVEDLGGGLMLTGGERSFGTGGYFKSPLDDVLPVSMEIRQEHRKMNLAIAIALDRSGSMAAPVAGGKVKMDLANLGTVECIRMLSHGDGVAVIAVDSSPHVVIPMQDVTDPEILCPTVRKIQSMGGGIFVYEALVAAGRELAKAPQATKHVILFSDACDSEEPGDYQTLLKKFEDSGITVSVIGLGNPTDVHAPLLKDIAARGNGQIFFSSDARELPRLFAEDTMTVARSSFVKADPSTQPEGISGTLQPDARLLGNVGTGAFPALGGYNLSYLKPDSTAVVLSSDEYSAPLAAFWHRGLGRVAALTFEVDGEYTRQFASWQGQQDFLITHARWLLGAGDEARTCQIRIDRVGQEARVIAELDPDRFDTGDSDLPSLVVVPPGDERVATIQPALVWTGPSTLEARFSLQSTGTYRSIIKDSSKGFQRGPIISLPYSTEFAPRIDVPPGGEVLREMSRISGGVRRPDVVEVFKHPPRAVRRISLMPLTFALCVVALVLEIAGRRLMLWERYESDPESAKRRAQVPRSRRLLGWLPQWKIRTARSKSPIAEGLPSGSAADTTLPGKLAGSEGAPQSPETHAAAPNIYEQAKQRARRRME